MATLFCYGLSGGTTFEEGPSTVHLDKFIYSWSNLPRNTRMLLYTSSIYDMSTRLHARTSKEPSIHYEEALTAWLCE